MRLLLVTNGLKYGGAERVVEALALDAKERGDGVHVVATTRGGELGDSLRRNGVPVSILSIAAAFDARVPLKIFKIAQEFAPDIIHSHLAVADIATAMAAPLIPRAVPVSTIHNSGVELSRFKRTLWHAALTRFARVMAVSETVRSLLPCGIQATVLRPSLIRPHDPVLSRSDARRELGLSEHDVVVMGVGRLVPVKGFDVLAKAAEHLTTPKARILIIGDGPERESLRFTELECLGARENAGALVAAADIVVCPSRSEGFPQVPLHAMAAGVPVVATRVGGTPEVVVHGETGFLVAPDDAESLASALDALLADPALREEMGRRGRARLLSEGLTRAAMIEQTRSIYRSVL